MSGPDTEVHQNASHAELLQAKSYVRAEAPGGSPAQASLDAIVIPASRGAHALLASLELSVLLGVQLVALCSRKTLAGEVVELAARTPGSRVLAIDVPPGYAHSVLPRRTTAPEFRRVSAGRTTDLSVKRNLGLLLARLHGWSKILFLDDDIDSPSGETRFDLPTVRRLGAELDSRQVTGLVCRSFPDNSVVCHARRLAGLPQDNFVTGSALGVNCADQPLPFFPDIYNEDWFFFSRQAANRQLSDVGEARQEPYDPYASTQRAREEEFGDLLAEGLYALFDRQTAEVPFGQRLAKADSTYWANFMIARAADLTRTADLLRSRDDEDAHRAVRSLQAAERQLQRITPALCADFLRAWQADLADWQTATLRMNNLSNSQAAIRRLRLHPVQPQDLLQAV